MDSDHSKDSVIINDGSLSGIVEIKHEESTKITSKSSSFVEQLLVPKAIRKILSIQKDPEIESKHSAIITEINIIPPETKLYSIISELNIIPPETKPSSIISELNIIPLEIKRVRPRIKPIEQIPIESKKSCGRFTYVNKRNRQLPFLSSNDIESKSKPLTNPNSVYRSSQNVSLVARSFCKTIIESKCERQLYSNIQSKNKTVTFSNMPYQFNQKSLLNSFQSFKPIPDTR